MPVFASSLCLFGFGYVARALSRSCSWASVQATTRSPEKAESLRKNGIDALVFSTGLSMPEIKQHNASWLVSIPPDDTGCPLWRAMKGEWKQAGWIGYLSTTGVYGDRGGGWAFEETLPAPNMSQLSKRRTTAETQWRKAGAHIFRLSAIYGPGRSALDRVAAGKARRVIKAGQVFNRIHVDDLVGALLASAARPNPARIYNVADDHPAPPQHVISLAASLLKRPEPPAIPFDHPALPKQTTRFYLENKRISNARLKAELGWSPRFPSYRDGLAHLAHAFVTPAGNTPLI